MNWPEEDMKILIPFFILVLLSSCATDTEVGKGPIVLSPRAQWAFEQYLKTENPTVFVVSEDGYHSYYFYCRDVDGCLASNSTYKAIKGCEEKSVGLECKVYAQGRNVVWEK